MLIVVDPQSGIPVYRQLMDQIKFHIASGMLEPGDELPSTRALSSDLGVNPMTISKAYGYLEKEQVVERRPGRPLVVRKLAGDEMRGRKVERLRDSLTSTVTVVQQLGIDKNEALQIFSDMLDGQGVPSAPDPEEEER